MYRVPSIAYFRSKIPHAVIARMSNHDFRRLERSVGGLVDMEIHE
jgi:hypothetical protein